MSCPVYLNDRLIFRCSLVLRNRSLHAVSTVDICTGLLHRVASWLSYSGDGVASWVRPKMKHCHHEWPLSAFQWNQPTRSRKPDGGILDPATDEYPCFTSLQQ